MTFEDNKPDSPNKDKISSPIGDHIRKKFSKEASISNSPKDIEKKESPGFNKKSPKTSPKITPNISPLKKKFMNLTDLIVVGEEKDKNVSLVLPEIKRDPEFMPLEMKKKKSSSFEEFKEFKKFYKLKCIE